jgi:sigma-B regulation protein RsbU (phosphoserine phosphatase)
MSQTPPLSPAATDFRYHCLPRNGDAIMNFVDLSGSSRISRLMALTNSLRQARSPYDALLRYTRFLGDAYADRAQIILSTRGLPAGQYRVWRLRTDDGIEHVELCDPWKKLDLPVHSGGALDRIIADAQPHLVHDLDWRDDPTFGPLLSPYRSMIAVPLFNERLPLNWSLMLTRDSARFTPTDLEDSVARATLIGSLLESLFVRSELAAAHAYIDSEVERMARIQRALLPDPIPQISGLDIAASYETFTQVGGDLYDIIPLAGQPERWCLFIGDASGHGPSAAVTAAMVQSTLHAVASESSGPAALTSKLNDHLCRKRVEGSFVTAVIAFYEPARRRLSYCSSGHPPLLVRSETAAKFLDGAGGLPMGIMADALYDEASVELRPNETVIFYTDGITEARGPGDRMFEARGIQTALQGCDPGATWTIEQLRRSLTEFQHGRRPVDDQTVVAIHVRP